MMSRSPSSLLLRLVALTLSLAALPAAAFDESDLLPVDQAFVPEAQAVSRDRIELRWKIADGYYLYRQRTSVSAESGFRAGSLQLPEGQHKHDEYFGDVETYRGSLRAMPGTAEPGAATATLKIKYQGCADAGVCFPPQTRTLQVRLPGAGGASPLPVAAQNGANPLAALLGQGGAAGAVDPTPLPPERLRLRGHRPGWQHPAAALHAGPRLLPVPRPHHGEAGRRRRHRNRTAALAAGQSLHDAHFGEVAVYFDQTEVPVPLLRDTAKAARATLVATFQGCQRDGICYPPMTRRVKLSLPAGLITPKSTVLPGLPPASRAARRPPTKPPAPPHRPPRPNRWHRLPAPVRRSRPMPMPRRQCRAQPATGRQPTGLIAVLLLALLGGLILNLMPCVLPVLSLKVIGLARSGESHAHARRHALWYTLGVLVAFAGIGALVLALRAAGQAAGWGFQLQHPWFVAAMAYLMFAVGLGLSGMYTRAWRSAATGKS
jgi:thiol:disulfide interchange protein DsbD